MKNLIGFALLVVGIATMVCAYILPVLSMDDTNAPPTDVSVPRQVFGITNNTVTFNGTVIGYIKNGTNYTAVPDVQSMSQAHDTGFTLGVRYGAVASKRNPDCVELGALVRIAQTLMQQEQQAQQAQRVRTIGK